ncbi:unnamed protein product [Staurois parvus]|uniref:Secreted protein n=1 Tax=Staurois parvus TaxID=386267 RepID=A0ABN9AUU4_9NEOB|nr:unnamed protein product [Staurois parvus]
MLSLVSIARVFFFFLGRMHVISTGPICTAQTEGQGFYIVLELKHLLLQALASVWLNTDRSHKTTLTSDEKKGI